MQIKETKIPYLQYAAALIVSLSVPCGTIYTTWASPALPKMFNNETRLETPLIKEEASWMVSITAVSTAFGGILLVLISDKIQRKHILLLCGVLLFVPWIVTMYATSVLSIIIARGLAGQGLTMILVLAPLYIGEIADVEIRGRLCSLLSLNKLIGSLLILSVGPHISFEALTFICSTFPLVFFSLFSFMPESPHYLVKKANLDKAKRNLFKLAASKENVQSRLDNIIDTVNYDTSEKSKFCDIILRKRYRRSLLILLGVKTVQQLSGVGAVELHFSAIMELLGSTVSSGTLSIFIILVQIPAVLTSTFLVDKVGRRPLLLISALGCSVALIVFGIYFCLLNTHELGVGQMSWLPLTAATLYFTMSHVGLFTVPYVLMGELFATNVKDASATICVIYDGTLSFVVMKCLKPLSDLWGLHTIFWIFSGICVWGSVFIYFKVPETKGKTFLEIQEKIKNEDKVYVNTCDITFNST